MEYEQWLVQLEKDGKALREKKDFLKKAAKKCSPETQEDLRTFLDKLDQMFSVEKVPEGMELLEEQEEPRLTKDDFHRVRIAMGSAIGDLAVITGCAVLMVLVTLLCGSDSRQWRAFQSPPIPPSGGS